MGPSPYDLTFADWERELASAQVSPTHARTLWQLLYHQRTTDFSQAPQLPRPLAQWALGWKARGVQHQPPAVAADLASSDGLTRKLLLRLVDGQEIETVLMGFRGRFTACISSQAGCAMGCVFCATGQMGFVRHLRTSEIVAQVQQAQDLLAAAGLPGLRNLVFMGMGEPLHNYDAVMRALEIITDRRGLNLAPSKITISTVGVVPGILRLAQESAPYRLAVSLHAATEEERAALVPASRRWPLADLMEACRAYLTATGRRIFFEWTLIAGKNDTPEQAERLVALLAGMDAHVNLIPLNSTQRYAGEASAAASALRFQEMLKAGGLPCTIRQRRGIDVAAGCGQLRAERSPAR